MPERIPPPQKNRVGPEANKNAPSPLDEAVQGKSLEELLHTFEEHRERVRAYAEEHGKELALELPDELPKTGMRGREWKEEHRLALLTELMRRFLTGRYGELTPHRLMQFVYGTARTDYVTDTTRLLYVMVPKTFHALVSLKSELPEAAAERDAARGILKNMRIEYMFEKRAIPFNLFLDSVRKALAFDGDRVAFIEEKLSEAAITRQSNTAAISSGKAVRKIRQFLRSHCTPDTLKALGESVK